MATCISFINMIDQTKGAWQQVNDEFDVFAAELFGKLGLS